MGHQIPTLEQAKSYINSLDLTPIVARLVSVEKWSRKQALLACEQYKTYLFLVKKYGSQYQLPPSTDIDEVWHAHILHTQIYTEFCQKVFGFFLHHNPFHGSVLQKQGQDMFEVTQNLHYKETGDYIYAVRPIPLKIKTSWIIKKIKEILRSAKGRLGSIESESA